MQWLQEENFKNIPNHRAIKGVNWVLRKGQSSLWLYIS